MNRVALGACALLPVACGAGQRPATPALEAASRLRQSPAIRDAERVAPQLVALSDIEQKKADEAAGEGDLASAEIYAARAAALLDRAVATTRLLRAEAQEREARAKAEHAAAELKELLLERAARVRDNTALEKKIAIAKELEQPKATSPADPKREAARRVAADSLRTEAQLLCGAARLLAKADATPALEAAEKLLSEPLAKEGGPAIDLATRARAACLDALTKGRRGTSAVPAEQPDVLLTELGAAGSDVVRDERGVVVTLREVFDSKEARLTPSADKSLADLGRVWKTHPSFRIQVAVHDAAKTTDASGARGALVAAALAKASDFSVSQVNVVHAGTKLPVVDPASAKLRARTARVEVVFVAAAP